MTLERSIEEVVTAAVRRALEEQLPTLLASASLPVDPDRGYTVDGAAEYLQVTPSCIRERVKTGELEAIRLGKYTVIPHQSIQALVARELSLARANRAVPQVDVDGISGNTYIVPYDSELGNWREFAVGGLTPPANADGFKFRIYKSGNSDFTDNLTLIAGVTAYQDIGYRLPVTAQAAVAADRWREDRMVGAEWSFSNLMHPRWRSADLSAAIDLMCVTLPDGDTLTVSYTTDETVKLVRASDSETVSVTEADLYGVPGYYTSPGLTTDYIPLAVVVRQRLDKLELVVYNRVLNTQTAQSIDATPQGGLARFEALPNGCLNDPQVWSRIVNATNLLH